MDILVPTYGEPLAVLQRSLLGCTQQSYPHTSVLVLDDSGREEVKRQPNKLGCRYMHRPERLHAKAGNLNAGLSQCHGELVAVFDADFILSSSGSWNTASAFCWTPMWPGCRRRSRSSMPIR